MKASGAQSLGKRWRVARLEKACGLKWNANSLAFYSESFSQRIMYPWPMGDFDYAMDVAFDTAMNYLERPGQAEKFVAVLSNTCPAKGACWSARA